MKRLELFITVLMLVALLPAASVAQEEARGFETPEACAEALFAALQTQDVVAMDACIAFDEMAASFDFQAHAELMGRIYGNTSLVPASDPFAIEYNRIILRYYWYRKLEATNMLAIDQSLSEALFLGESISQKDDEYANVMQEIEQWAGLNVFSLLAYEGIITPDEIVQIREYYYKDKRIESLRKEMAVWQIDNYVEFCIKTSLVVDAEFTNGAQFIIPLRLVELNGRWLVDPNDSLISTLLQMTLGFNPMSLAIVLP
jgi:hypothetical protein